MSGLEQLRERIHTSRQRFRLAVVQACVNRCPAREHAVVAGSPDDEGNSVEVVRRLARRMPVYWLVGDDPDSLTWLISDADGRARVRALRRTTFRAYLAYFTARYVFFTHGLYGSVHPPAHKTFVNLWHGDGPKVRKGFATARSTFVVSGTQLWGRQRARSFGVGERGLLVTGNPRVDQFARPASDAGLRQLGIDPAKPLVLWLPTYRTTQYRLNRLDAVRNWSDAHVLSASTEVIGTLDEAAQEAAALGVTLAVKPHHLDADKYAVSGLRLVTGEGLREARIGLYQLLGRADGLITDYSSVWTDFLALDRPIGFYCPDFKEYVAGRSLNIDDYPALLPGPMLANGSDFADFLRSCVQESPSGRVARNATIRTIGACTDCGATERLLDALRIPVQTTAQ
ncbi:CDP-glycerol glycerophosphotransferase family protein [soil metagenome]